MFSGIAVGIAVVLLFSWIILVFVSPTSSIAPVFSISHETSDSLLDTTMNETLGVSGATAVSFSLSDHV